MAKAKTPTHTPDRRRLPAREEVAARQTKKQIAFGRKQARQNRIILISVIALAVVIVGIIVAGVLTQVVLKAQEPVAVVNGTKIRQGEHSALVTYYRNNLQSTINSYQSELDGLDSSDTNNQFLISFYQQQIQQLESQLASVETTALEDLIDGVLIAEKAKEAGLTVTKVEIDDTINADLQRLAEQSAQPTITATTNTTETVPTATPVPKSVLDQLYQSALQGMGINDEQFRNMVKRSLLREKVQELLASQVPTTGLVAQVQMIVTDTEEAAIAALARVQAGEDWAAVAKEVSTDAQVESSGGDMGWVTTGQVSRRWGQPLEDLIFSMEVGTIDRVESNGKFYVVRVTERNENGPLPQDELDTRRSSALSDWLAARRASPDVKIERRLNVGATATPAG